MDRFYKFWNTLFKNQERNKVINNNINNITEIKAINDHISNVYSLILLQNGRLASCSADNRIKIYNINHNYNCELTIITEHTDAVTSICEIGYNKLASSSWDNNIRVFNFNINNNYYVCDSILRCHTDKVFKVISLSNHRFASCSADSLINIYYNKFPYNLIITLKGHNDYISSLIKLNGKEILLSISYDKTLRFWNLSSYQNESVINGVKSYRVHFCNNDIVEYKGMLILGGDEVITIIDLGIRKIIKEIEDEKLGIVLSIMFLKNDILLFGNENNINELNVNNFKFKVIKQNAHNYYITCILRINNKSFITSSLDNVIKVWSYKSIN